MGRPTWTARTVPTMGAPRAAPWRRTRSRASTALVVALLLQACAGDGRSEVLVSAATSLSEAFAEIEVAFEFAHPEADVVLNLAGSSTLGEQILQGARVDVFASASVTIMSRVVEAGLVADPAIFAANRIQLAVPAGNPGGVTGLSDLARPDLVVGLCAVAVPCGALAHLVLTEAGVTAQPDSEEPNVRALLLKLEEAELDAGMVYTTDVLASEGKVEGVGDPLDPTIDYPIAVLTAAPHPSLAADFVAFVLSEQGRAILDSHGFTTP